MLGSVSTFQRRQDACSVANRNHPWPWDQGLSTLPSIPLEIEVYQPLTHSWGNGSVGGVVTDGVDPRSEQPTCGEGREACYLTMVQGAYYSNEWAGGAHLRGLAETKTALGSHYPSKV